MSSKAWRVAAALASSTILALAVGCGGDDEPEGGGAASSGGDTGETITMWTRAATDTQSERLVDAYNASHENKVELTIIPTDNYQARIAAAAGGKNLPDVFASDVIYAPNYTSQGLYLDITDRIDELEFADSLAPAHMRLGTYEDAKYTVPHTLDLSVLFWNKDLYKKAGLDPEQGPTTLRRWPRRSRERRAVARPAGSASANTRAWPSTARASRRIWRTRRRCRR
jgi:multiple sugar transport system substrate-binding protein